MTGAAGCCWEDPSLVGIAALVCAARKAERFMTWATMITERFINGHRANSEGALW